MPVLLGHADGSDPLVAVLRDHLAGLPSRPAGRASPYFAIRTGLAEAYRRIVLWRHFQTVVVVVAVGYFLTKVPVTIRVQTDDTGLDRDAQNADIAHVAQLIAAITSGLCVTVGLTRLRRSRLRAHRWFKRAVVVSILVYEVFAFYYAQFAALTSLSLDLLLYAALGYMIAREATETDVAALAVRPAAAPAPAG